MKRRDLIKTGLATLGASAIALSGCSKTDNSSYESIIPKQTAQYEFSAPLPFDFKTIDAMVELNSTIKKSQIKTLYNNVPPPLVSKYNGLLHELRGKGNDSIKTLDDFGQYVKYALDQGFEFTYLLNSPKDYTEQDFLAIKDDFLELLDYIYKIGVKNIKVGTEYTAFLINKYAPNKFNLQVSVCYDLRNISQYNDLFERYPNFNLIDMARDEHRNFGLFKNLKKIYPDKKIELLTNQMCLKGCANRYNGCKKCSFLNFNKYNNSLGRSALARIVTVYPWDFEHYSSLGINNFKYVAYRQLRYEFNNLSRFKLALNIIENGYENYTWGDLQKAGWGYQFMFNDKNRDIKLSDIAPLFPKIKYFIDHGDECNVKCKAQCNYCFECAKELEKVLYLV